MDKTLIVALIMVLVEGLKLKELASEYAPLVAVVLGIMLNLGNMVLFSNQTLVQAIIQGIIMGLSAIGLYQASHSARILLRRIQVKRR